MPDLPLRPDELETCKTAVQAEAEGADGGTSGRDNSRLGSQHTHPGSRPC